MVQIGDKVRIINTESLSKAEMVLLRSLDHKVTVEDIDPVPTNDGIKMAIYSEEIPGFLFTWEDYQLL